MSEMTDIDRRALQIIRDHPGIASQALAHLLGLRRSCGIELTAQGAGRMGAQRGRRLEKMKLVSSSLVHDGYCLGFRITEAGRQLLLARPRSKP